MRMAPGSNVDEWDKQHTSLHFVKGCNEKWVSLCSCACLPLWNSGSLMSLPVSALMSFVKDNYGQLDERVSLCGPLVDGAFLTFPVHFGWPIPDAQFKNAEHKNNGVLDQFRICSVPFTHPSVSTHTHICLLYTPDPNSPGRNIAWHKRERLKEEDWDWKGKYIEKNWIGNKNVYYVDEYLHIKVLPDCHSFLSQITL